MTPLDIRYRYRLSARLMLNHQEELNTIPGVWVSKRGPPWIDASIDAAWIVEAALTAWNVPYLLDLPDFEGFRPYDEQAEKELTEKIRLSAARNWLVGLEPGPWTLQPFQREAIWFALERGGSAMLREEPGAGKTVQAALIATLASTGPVLIVTRSGSPVPQWCREIERFIATTAYEFRAPSNRRIKDGTLANYLDSMNTQGKQAFVVCGWATLRICVEELLQIPWTQVIFDESHNAKAPKRKKFTKLDDEWHVEQQASQSAAAAQIAEVTPRRLCTTATPVPDRRRDLWGQFSLISPKAWGQTRTRFSLRYCGGLWGEYGLIDEGSSNTNELHGRQSFFFFNVPKEVSHAQLPPCRVDAQYIPFERQDKPATGFKREMKRLAKASSQGDASARGLLMECQLAEAATRKRSEVIATALEYAARGRVILFTGRHRDCFDLGERLRKLVKRSRATKHIRVLTAIDKVESDYVLPTVKERQALLNSYRAEESTILIATADAWGESLDGLQVTDLLGIVALPWSPGKLVQWMGRVRRLGQDRAVTILLFIAEGTADEAVSHKLLAKVPDAIQLGKNIELEEVRNAVLGLNDSDAMKEMIEKLTTNPPSEYDWG